MHRASSPGRSAAPHRAVLASATIGLHRGIEMRGRAFALMIMFLLAGACSGGSGHSDEDNVVGTPSSDARAELSPCERYLVVSSARAVVRDVYGGGGSPGHRAAA